MKTILVTGSAGFIGYSLGLKLLDREYKVIGIDNHNDYYDQNLKEERVKRLLDYSNYKHYRIDLGLNEGLKDIFNHHKPKVVVNFAAQAGVRNSIKNPLAYINSNIVGFANILENCRNYQVEHLVYASSSSVYGANTKMPFLENCSTDHPLSLYAASKKSNELMAHSYSYLYQLPTTGLRFFTVYGPWGRPDMALFKFTKNILSDEPIDVFNYGNHFRDFTYIDDIIEGVVKIADRPAAPNLHWKSDKPDLATSVAPWRIYNIGNNQPVNIMDCIYALEKVLKKKAKLNFLPLQLGDVQSTHANICNLNQDFNYTPSTPVVLGISKFVDWYKNYYKQ